MKLAVGIGATLSLVGLGGLVWWRAKKAAPAPTPGPNENSNPQVFYASLRQGSFDEDIGGGWTLLDVTKPPLERDPKINPDTDIHIGNIVSLFLSNRGASPKAFNVRVIGNSGDDYNGQWVTGQPAGGPQMIDFRGAHIFAFH